MFNQAKESFTLTSTIIGAAALGAGAAVVMLKAVDHVRKMFRERMRESLCLVTREDREAIERMEGEGGPAHPLPIPPSVTAH